MKNLNLTKIFSVCSSTTETITTTGTGIFISTTVSHSVCLCLYTDIYKYTERNPHIYTVILFIHKYTVISLSIYKHASFPTCVYRQAQKHMYVDTLTDMHIYHILFKWVFSYLYKYLLLHLYLRHCTQPRFCWVISPFLVAWCSTAHMMPPSPTWFISFHHTGRGLGLNTSRTHILHLHQVRKRCIFYC